MSKSLPEIKYIPVDQLKTLDNNPRQIKDKRFDKLKKSLKDDPDYFTNRPCLVDDSTGELIIIAGNMRYRAACDLNYKEVPCIVNTLKEEKRKRWIIKDNIEYGDWDTDILSADFELEELEDWGLDLKDIGLSLNDPDESQKKRPAKLTITFEDKADRDNAQKEINEILLKYEGVTIKATPKN